MISYNAEIKPEEIVIDGGNRVFQLIKGEQCVASVSVIPNGATAYANYTVKSSNERGASSKCLVLVVPKRMAAAEGIAAVGFINSVFTFFFILIYGGLPLIGWIGSLK